MAAAPDRMRLDAQCRRGFALVHHTRAMEMVGEFGVVGDVVAMGKKHQAHAAHLLDAPDQRRSESRRIDEHVAALLIGPHDQVGPRAETRLRGEAAKINVAGDLGGKCLCGRLARCVAKRFLWMRSGRRPKPSARAGTHRRCTAAGRRSTGRRDRETSRAQSDGRHRNRCKWSRRRNRPRRFPGAAPQVAPWQVRFALFRIC